MENENKCYIEKLSDSEKRGEIGGKYWKAVEKGLKKFVKDAKFEININKDEGKNSGNHLEYSYLCHGIWNKIMENAAPIYRNDSFYWTSKEEYWEEYNKNKNCDYVSRFHCDIMNNPKASKKNIYSCGSVFRFCSKEKRKELEEIYHGIGNMAPIPWFEILSSRDFSDDEVKEVSINGQKLHSSLDERWDLFLGVLKNNWSSWNNRNRDLTFEKYMILTCQHVYYEEI